MTIRTIGSSCVTNRLALARFGMTLKRRQEDKEILNTFRAFEAAFFAGRDDYHPGSDPIYWHRTFVLAPELQGNYDVCISIPKDHEDRLRVLAGTQQAGLSLHPSQKLDRKPLMLYQQVPVTTRRSWD